MLLTLDEAKVYLHVDSRMETPTVLNLLSSAEKIVADVARLSAEEWQEICECNTNKEITIRGRAETSANVVMIRDLLREGVYYALGYLFEHREEADHHSLVMTLRYLLSSIREGGF